MKANSTTKTRFARVVPEPPASASRMKVAAGASANAMTSAEADVAVKRELDERRRKFIDAAVAKYRSDELVAESQETAADIRSCIHKAIEAIAGEMEAYECHSRAVNPLLASLHGLEVLDGALERLLACYEVIGGDQMLDEIVDARARAARTGAVEGQVSP
jgi:hypothetical protein